MPEALRRRLIEAGRILDFAGQGDYVAGHVSARLPESPDRFLMKPARIGLEEMTQENIITVDLSGEKVAGASPRHNEVFIHSEILRARPDLNAVIHTHAPHAVVFSSLGKPLLPVSHAGAFFHAGLPVFAETSGLILTPELGAAVARCLGNAGALILRNHGIVTAAATLEEAVMLTLKLEDACRMQLMAEACGGPRFVSDPAEARTKGQWMNRPEQQRGVFDYLLRKIAREWGA
jgi:L-fuculose-phosphate aldolase